MTDKRLRSTPPRPELAPASAFQRWVWNLQIPACANNNLSIRWRLRGALDRRALGEAIDELFRRHEALRTTLTQVDGQLQQRIWPFRSPTMAGVRIRSAQSLDDIQAHEAIAAEKAVPFDLAGSTLCRVSLFSIDGCDDDHVLALVMNHAIVDGDSCSLLSTEMERCLAARLTGADDPSSAVKAQFRDYAAWERSPEREQHAEFWRPRLAPTGFKLSARDGFHDSAPMTETVEGVPVADAARRLRALAVQQRTTFPLAVVGAVAVAFSPWAEGALRVGVICANRFDPAFRAVVGPLVSVLPLRIPLDPDSTFVDVLRCTRNEWIAAIQHNVPLQVMYDLAGTDEIASSKIYDVDVNVLTLGVKPPTVLHGHGGAMFQIASHRLAAPPPVRVSVHAPNGVPCGAFTADVAGHVEMICSGDPRVLPSHAVATLADHLAHVLAYVTEAPHEPIRHAVAAHSPIAVLDPSS